MTKKMIYEKKNLCFDPFNGRADQNSMFLRQVIRNRLDESRFIL